MKVLAVSSPHTASTRDVWTKLCLGLTANGVEVQPFDLVPRISLFEQMTNDMHKKKQELPHGWNPATLAYEAVLGAALAFDCDTVIVVSPQYFPEGITDLLRKVGIKSVAYCTECPYEDEIHMPVVASSFDMTLVNDLNSLGLFQSFCDKVMYTPHSYNPLLHYPPADEDSREQNTVFVGTGYQSRMDFFAKVDWPVPLDIHGGYWKLPKKTKNVRIHTGTEMAHKMMLSRQTGVRPNLIGMGSEAQKKKFAYEIVEPEETAEIYRDAGAAFSLHRTLKYFGSEETIITGEAYSLGPRNWELAACRTFQVSDFRQELVDVFEDSVPLYETPRELGDLMRRAFNEPEWRKELAYRQWEKAQPYSCQNVMRPVAQFLAA